MDVAEIGLDAMPREVAEADEGLAMPPAVIEVVALDLGIASGISVLIAEATMDLGGGVPLLGRCVLLVGEDAIDDRLDRAEERISPFTGYGQELCSGIFQAAGFSLMPSTKTVPLMTSTKSGEPFNDRQRFDADSISLNTIVRHATRLPLPFVLS